MSNNSVPWPSRIIFFFPYRGIGGVSLLFLRMASAVREACPLMRVVIVDYPDGYMATHLKDPNIELVTLQAGKPIKLYDDDALILQSLPLWRLPDELQLSQNTKLMMWQLHPLNVLSPSRRPNIDRGTILRAMVAAIRDMVYLGQFWQCQRLLKLAHKKHGLIFMDQENYEVACRLNDVQLDQPRFVPVPTVDTATKQPKGRFSDDSLNVGWVGRLEDFKLPILFHTIDRLERICNNTGRKIIFHIAGDGPGIEQIRARESSLRQSGSSLELRPYGLVAAEKLDHWLAEHVQVLFAMGTAALDGAKNSIPTVLLDFSYSPINGDYVYDLLHETKGFTLGRLIRAEQIKPGNSSLEEILTLVASNPESIGQDARRYFETNHSLDKVTAKFLESVQNCDFKANEVFSARLLKPDLVMRLYLLIRRIIRLPSFKISSK